MWADIAAPALALGQAIGRWGNFINQEVYGLPTNLPWKIHIDPLYRIDKYADQAYYHPLFLYELPVELWRIWSSCSGWAGGMPTVSSRAICS